MITIIVAIAENSGIGFENRLLVHLPGDLKRFKKITMGHSLIMGKKTWESLPVKPLAGRRNIVLTDKSDDAFEGAETARSISEAIDLCDDGKEIFIIGGGSVYRQFMPLADRLMVTHVHRHFEADTFFPEIDNDEWVATEEEEHSAGGEDPVYFTYTTYMRRNRK